VEHNSKWNRMAEIKEILETQHGNELDSVSSVSDPAGNGEEPSADLEDELSKLSRDNLRLCEEIAAALGGGSESDGDSILGSINILKALRQSSEAETYAPPPPRAASNPKGSRNPKRKLDTGTEDRESVAAESPAPGPSPKVIVPNASRLKAGSRAGSVPAGREASVKIEDGVDSGIDSSSKREVPQSRSSRHMNPH
jgi:SAGA-associated factor 29